MPYKLISLLPLQIARMLRLVRSIEPGQLADGKRWGVLVRGRGFTRLLQEDLLVGPGLIRPSSYYVPRPREFYSEASALLAAQQLRLVPRRGSTPSLDSSPPRYWTRT